MDAGHKSDIQASRLRHLSCIRSVAATFPTSLATQHLVASAGTPPVPVTTQIFAVETLRVLASLSAQKVLAWRNAVFTAFGSGLPTH